MPGFGTKLAGLAKPSMIVATALLLSFATGAVPARAQDIFGGLFRSLFPPAPGSPPVEYRSGPAMEQPRRKPRSRPKLIPLEQTTVREPIKPRPPGEIDNPVPALLADGTLRRGDLVMFPDGLRVFTGTPGGRHKLTDFKPVSKAGKAVSRATRTLASKLRPGENTAWSTEGHTSTSRLATNTTDVETTGSVTRKSARKRSRSR
jgi:hypothetical protein